jgi:hypothetical protein
MLRGYVSKYVVRTVSPDRRTHARRGPIDDIESSMHYRIVDQSARLNRHEGWGWDVCMARLKGKMLSTMQRTHE